MKTSTIVAILIAIVVVGAAAWYFTQPAMAPSNSAGLNGSPNQGNLGGTATGTPQQPAQGDGSTVGQNLILGLSTSATLGSYVSAFNGMTLYTYSPDKPGVSNCTGQCAANWPPYTVSSAGDINVPASITGAVGTTKRADGSLQVTYKGMPLYFYVKDTKAGDTTGQGVGGVWFVAK